LFLPLGLNNRRRALAVVASGGEKRPAPPLRDFGQNGAVRPPKSSPDRVEMPLFRVGHIVIASMGVSVSAGLIEACCERGIRISFLARGGKPFAMISSPMLTAIVITRREQLMAYGDGRGVELAKAIVRGKLGNQAAMLRYFGKYLKAADPEAFAKLSAVVAALSAARNAVAKVAAPNIDAARQALLSIEGSAGNQYWRGFRLVLPPGVEFDAREHRGAPDPINSALNYGYGVLYSEVWGAIMNAGLEPFAGFLHVDRPGKPSVLVQFARISCVGGTVVNRYDAWHVHFMSITKNGKFLHRCDSPVSRRPKRPINSGLSGCLCSPDCNTSPNGLASACVKSVDIVVDRLRTAERAGFEPASLLGRCFGRRALWARRFIVACIQPLCHLSVSGDGR
jgi:CRISPR-associated protein Cas1